MEVILIENVPSVGFLGDVVEVKPGYFRNYLFPKKLAVPANRSRLAEFEHQKKLLEVKKSEKKAEATDLQGRLEKVTFTVTRPANAQGKLFGAITATEIFEGLASQGFDIDKRLIKFENPIKEVGDFKVEIRLHQEVSAWVAFKVEGNVSEEETQEAAPEAVEAPVEAPAEDDDSATPEATQNEA